jgi:hypothetical protein
MRTRHLALAAVLAASLPAVIVAACSQGNPEGGQMPPSSQSGASASEATPTGTPPAEGAVAKGVPTMSSCKDLPVDITNDMPDGGIVMDNAAPLGDAGPSDRINPVEKVFVDNRDKFRCCFDAGGKRPPHLELKMTLVLELKPSGEVREASFDRAETDPTSDAVEECMLGIAKSLKYEESESGRDTTFRHRFRFKTH